MILRPTARSEAYRVREILLATIIITSLMWGCVTAGSILIAGGSLGHVTRLGPAYYDAVRRTAIVAGIAVIALWIWRGRHAWILGRVALWVEERIPALQYALVTAVDVTSPALERVVQRSNIPRVAVRAAILAYARAAVAVVLVAFLLSRVLPLTPDAAAGTPAPSGGVPTPATRASRLSPLRAHVIPPAYAHRRPVDLADPSAVRALTGSAITLRGPGAAGGLVATLADSALTVRPADDGWGTTFTMPGHPTALRVIDGAATRIVVIDPIADEPPTVVLVAPRADATVRRAPESIGLDAEATDDIALADGDFEYIVSTGQSEGSYKSVTGTVGRVTFAATRTGALRATLPLGPLNLGPGSLLSIRAVARDANTVTGPGVGVSDTRTLRVARPEEYDSLALAAAPPPPDEQAFMSQRMLVMETEALVARRHRTAADRYRAESVQLSGEEERLRQRVDDILNGGPGGVGADSAEPGERQDIDVAKGGAGSATASRERRFLTVAYQAMADAARSLAVGLPDTALPSARRALVALDSARVMNRLYLRGAPPKLVVDIGRVRLKGAAGGPSDSVAPGPRLAAPASDSVRRLVAGRLAALLALSERAPVATADSLALLQVAALPIDPALASALGDAAAALRAARDARPALARVRREVAPRAHSTSGLSPATVAPPL